MQSFSVGASGAKSSWANRIGLNVEQFGDDIKKDVVEKRIQEDRRSGIRSGVNGTPTFFINGSRYDDPPDYNSLLAALESALELHSV
jgi:protein-disulfide isomerase